MKVVTSCITHEGIAQKVGKWSYMENKEAARQAMHLDMFTYFPAADCWEWELLKMGVVN